MGRRGRSLIYSPFLIRVGSMMNEVDDKPEKTEETEALTDGSESLLLIDDHEEEVSEGGRKVKRRGIFLLPNLLTTGAMFAGFYAVILGMGGQFYTACGAIVVAMVLDGLDGRVARLTNTQSAFGAEYDSLSDMLSFGVAPALICFSWALSELGKVGWTATFVYMACAALRLARFNVQAGTQDKRYFVGLASPAAAGVVVFMVWTSTEFEVEVNSFVAGIAALVTFVTGILMVLNIRYYSFKDLDFHNRVPFIVILLVVMAFVVVSWNPPTVLFMLAVAYALSGPVMTIYKWRKARKKKAADTAEAEVESVTPDENKQEGTESV